MGLFKKKTVAKIYDKENKKPVIKASICNGEQVTGFKDIHTVNRCLQDNPDNFDLVEWVLFDVHTEAVYEAEVDKIYKQQ